MTDRPGTPGTLWTREEAVRWYEAFKAEYERTPTLTDMIPYHMSFRRLFGSIQGFQAFMGDEPNRVGRPRKAA